MLFDFRGYFQRVSINLLASNLCKLIFNFLTIFLLPEGFFYLLKVHLAKSIVKGTV